MFTSTSTNGTRVLPVVEYTVKVSNGLRTDAWTSGFTYRRHVTLLYYQLRSVPDASRTHARHGRGSGETGRHTPRFLPHAASVAASARLAARVAPRPAPRLLAAPAATWRHGTADGDARCRRCVSTAMALVCGRHYTVDGGEASGLGPLSWPVPAPARLAGRAGRPSRARRLVA